jgi:hypothetical protein
MRYCIICESEISMRTTVSLDDALYNEALTVADPEMDPADLFREAVRTFIRVRAGARLAALGGTRPEMADIERRRAPAAGIPSAPKPPEASRSRSSPRRART